MSNFLERIAKLPPERLALLAAELKNRLDDAERRLAQRIEPIAIVGMGCRFPGGAEDPDGYWQLLRDGVDAVREVPAERWDVDALLDPDPAAPGKMVTCRGGFFDAVDGFDPRFFGIAPREAVNVDPQHRLLLEVTWEALEDAGIAPDRLDGTAGGVFIGLCNKDYAELMLERPLDTIDAYSAAGGAGSMAAGRLAYLLGIRGPALTIDTACSSSLVALHAACESLRSGECRLAVSGGANLILSVETMIALSKAQMLSPDGRCSTFDESANGIVRGEGCGVVVLKRLSDAVADGDRIHAVIRSTAVNQDGRSSGITAPNGSAQEALMRAALERAGLTAAHIDYVEAHGTGTRLGDPIEVRALGAVYGARERSLPLRVGSVKTNLGHLEAAAGIAGVLKAVLALRAAQIPPHLHLKRPNPLIEWSTWPLEVVTRLDEWAPRTPDGIRRAAVSSFGFSGTNAHVIVEEAPRRDPVPPAGGTTQLLPLSARSDAALRQLASRYAEALSSSSTDARFADVCHTAAAGRARFAHRVCVVAKSRSEAAEVLGAWAKGEPTPTSIVAGSPSSSPEPVFLFTGQGAQYVDMGRELYDESGVFRDAFNVCDAGLRGELDVPLIDVVYPAADARARAEALIDETRYAQPALFAVQYALAQLWRSWGVEPAAVAGHSIGEYAAAVVAGVFSLEDALPLVAARGRLMQALPAGGAMAAVFAPPKPIETCIDGTRIVIAGYNSPGNTVVSGPESEVLTLLDRLAQKGIESRRLAVSHAFHSPLVEPMLADLEAAAARVAFTPPEIPFFSTATGVPLEADVVCSPAYWRDQARAPVRFTDAVRALHDAGHESFIEIGPHTTLCGLGAQTLEGRPGVFLPSMRRGQPPRQTSLGALAALHVRGAEPNWRAVIDAPAARKVRLPTYPFERQRYWVGWSARAHGADRAEAAVPSPRVDSTAGLLWAREWDRIVSSPAAMPRTAPIAEKIASRAADLVAEHDGHVYAASLPKLDALCAAYVVDALRALGAELASGKAWYEQALRERAGVLPEHARLLHRMHEMLAEDGVLAAGVDGEWRVVAEPPSVDAATQSAQLQAEFPAVAVETQMTARCGERLADVLTGRADPMDLLFPGGSLDATERLYAETPSFRIFNTLVAEGTAAAVRAHTAGGHTPRLLEIGAGTGGTTSRLLPLLGHSGVRYVFTDVSPLFLDRARAKFADYDCVDYRVLDIANDPGEQGFEHSSFDIVVASNVLHATPDLGRTLEHVRRLLAPGGMLVLLEGVRPQRFGDLTVGMTDGWWSFTDTEVRPGYALLGREGWLEQLARLRFDQISAATPAGEDERGVLAQQAVILAVAPESRRAAQPAPEPRATAWLALARPEAVSGQVARALQDAGIALEIFDPFAAHGFDADSPGAYADLLHRLAASSPRCNVLHLLSLDATVGARDDGAQVLAGQRCPVGTALRLAQGAATSGCAELVFVTRAAQPVGGTAVDPTGAALWGLRRTMAAEYPELRCRTLDLPHDWTEAIVPVAQWLAEDPAPREEEIAVRPAGILAARIVPHAEPEGAPLAIDPHGSYIVTGGLAGLGLRVAEWLAERRAGRLVLCGRSDPQAGSVAVLERLRALGTDVQVVLGDVADPECVRALVEAAGRDSLRGVLHCAGVTSDAVLLNQDWAHFESVMQAKVAGTWNLHIATRDLALAHFVLFSSGAAFLGSSGQANHAAANAFLSGVAWHRRARGLPGLAIDWGAWTEVGAATRGAVLERARAAGLGAIDPDTGLQLLERAMSGSAAQVAAIAVDWPAYFERHAGLAERGLFSRLASRARPGSSSQACSDDPPAGALAREVRKAAAHNRRAVLLDGLHAEAARVLALGPGQDIDPAVPLTELGLDSLMAVELRNALATQLDRSLPATLLFTYPTLAELAEHLATQLEGESTAQSLPSPLDESLESGDSLESLSSLGSLEALEERELEDLLESKLDITEARP